MVVQRVLKFQMIKYISMLNILYNKAGELSNIAKHNALSQEMFI